MAYSNTFRKVPSGRIKASRILGPWATPFYWRWLIFLKSTWSFFKYCNVIYWSWLVIRFIAKAFSICGIGSGDLVSSETVHFRIVGTLTSFLHMASRRPQGQFKTEVIPRLWSAFWQIYFIMDNNGSFHENYMEAWREKYPSKSFIMFVDNRDRLEVPYDEEPNDQEFLKHLTNFYYLRRAEGGLVEALGAKSLARVDIIDLKQHRAPGQRLGTLPLGVHGSANRIIYYFRKPEEREGHDIVSPLQDAGSHPSNAHNPVITTPGEQMLALNLVRTWDMYMMSILVLLPTVLSLLTGIVWSVVAVKYYGADVQTSTQTGFTVASYVVTTGALLIALITFIDSQAGKGGSK